MMEKLWNEYFAEKCAQLDSEEERTLLKKADELHREINKLIPPTQREAIDNYIALLYEIQSFSAKKAFFCGFNFAFSLLR